VIAAEWIEALAHLPSQAGHPRKLVALDVLAAIAHLRRQRSQT
jgi:hypothetical protein